MSNVQHSGLTSTDLHIPKVHKDSHVDGTDDIQDATSGQKGLATATQITKLDGVEAGATADQTDAEIKTAIENAATILIDDGIIVYNYGFYRYSGNADNAGFVINQVGYLGGITRFRDLKVFDGKEAEIIVIDGSTKTTTYYGNITFNGAETVDGRDLSVDGTKLDGVETGATKYPDTGEQAFLDADHTKLDGIEASADVTDATNVNSAGAVMESDVYTFMNASIVDKGTIDAQPTSYEICKETTLTDSDGTLSISFEIAVTTTPYMPSYGKIYRNGSPVGTERETVSGTGNYTTYVESIAGWSIGDAIQIWVRPPGGNPARRVSVKNFSISGENRPQIGKVVS